MINNSVVMNRKAAHKLNGSTQIENKTRRSMICAKKITFEAQRKSDAYNQ